MRIDVVTFRTFLLAGLALAATTGCGPTRGGGVSRVPVSVARVERRSLPYELEATGSVEPIRSVDVLPQVNGTILHVNFAEGDEVAAGQILFEIDPRPYRAALQQAEGALLRDLTQAESAAREAARYKTLAATNTVTQEDYEAKQSTADAAYAAVRSCRSCRCAPSSCASPFRRPICRRSASEPVNSWWRSRCPPAIPRRRST